MGECDEYTDQWRESTETPPGIIRQMLEEALHYRYRLKPLENIRITKDVMHFIWHWAYIKGGLNFEVDNMCRERDKKILSLNGRKVEIID